MFCGALGDGTRMVDFLNAPSLENSCVRHCLTKLTSSKCNELNGQATLSEWTKTTSLKKSAISNQLAHKKSQANTKSRKRPPTFENWKMESTIRKKAGLEKAF
ncbi:hypothetical protein TNCV_232741 [Trichonephila clavipes]|nr:hypothetical protein TNCV_232741 [Trichonephila clavipes]